MPQSDPVRIVEASNTGGVSDPVRIVNLDEFLEEICNDFTELSVGDVEGGNYVYLNENGVRLFGTARAWLDWNFDGASLAPGAAAPDLIQWNSTKIRVRAFDGNVTQEELSKVIEANHNWSEGTVLKFHVHWGPTTNNAGDVEWFLDWFAIEGSNYTGIATLSILDTASGTAWNEQRADFPDLVLPANYLIGTQLGFCLYRTPGPGNPDDTYPDDAAILTVGGHVYLDGFGSCQVGIKDC